MSIPSRRTAMLERNAPATGSADLVAAQVAAFALMAHADGEVASAERRRILSILRSDPMVAAFMPREALADAVAEHEANFRLDPELAQQIAREALAAVAGQDRAVRQIVAGCRTLIPADGVAHPAEYRALAEIKALLGYTDAVSLTAAERQSA